MKLAKYQAGMGFVSWMVMLTLVAFLATFLIKLTPVYIENFTIRSIFSGIEKESGSFSDADDIRETLTRRFNINDIDNVQASEVIIEPRPGSGFALSLDYERRVPFAHNISFVVSFSEKAQVRRGGALDQ